MHRRLPLARLVLVGARRLAALVLGVALAAALVRGGARYFFCPLMDEVVDADCCPPTRATPDSLQAPDCCVVRTIGTLPSAQSTALGPQVAPAPLAAVLPAAEATRLGIIAVTRGLEHEPTGPPPPTALRRAARLMVFLA